MAPWHLTLQSRTLTSKLLVSHRGAPVVVSGFLDGAERLRCDVTTIARDHPHRLEQAIHRMAAARLRQIIAEDAARGHNAQR